MIGTMNAADPAPIILIADDDEGIRSILVELLTDEGYDVLIAADGQEALDLGLSHRADLILLDLAMPRLDGPGFCRAYREHDGQAPVIVVSASNERDVAAAVETCGAEGHILKPFDLDKVVATVARHARPRRPA